MQHTAQAILSRIEKDVVALRSLLQTNPKSASGKKRGRKADRAKKVEVPVLKKFYTAAEAGLAKMQIDSAFEAGLLTYDKRRGMKMSVTKATDGWSPIR